MKTTKLFYLTGILLFVFSCGTDENDNYGLENKQINIELETSGGGAVSGSGKFKYGETINVEASPENEYTFDAWYINDEKYSIANPLTIQVEKDLKLRANFIQNAYTINLICEDGGSVSGGGTFTAGEKVIITAQAGEHHVFDGWYDESNIKITNDLEYSFEAYKTRDIIAKFIPNIYFEIDVYLSDFRTPQKYCSYGHSEGYQSSKVKVTTYTYKNNAKTEYYTTEEIKFFFSMSHQYAYYYSTCTYNSANSDYSFILNGVSKLEQDFNHQNGKYEFNPITSKVETVRNAYTYRTTTSKGNIFKMPKTVTVFKENQNPEYININ